ncbi:FtsB family cell division protein [Streptococcus sp. DD13]|uniref:FtsB family cell division protein n=1 Tax=Streptococcus sp. DD13 TaxID=1777881 RepID=UPI000795ACBC|nr:septum formation initiator family protein [Streptococcus sp. DD13]KXT77784.1 Cell division protein DivIC [Streptococcus sp. DD13]
MERDNVLQMNNHFIQEEIKKRRQDERENRKRNRFMGIILIFAVFLFILPTFNLVQSYQELQSHHQQLAVLKRENEKLTAKHLEEQALVKKLEDNDFALKYVRAKYQYSKEGEFVYNIPGLLPK